ncbi:lipopolysaccharide biosynthesis protein [Macrococcoides bohemicum]|uniref:lipopolysaccharide biosynthesis protein n=1 Tax=Macrococcoides bohemicum TaxID=1903056 RepID=UPI00165E866C|nr:hypothetical protein [Macrococcus bohemicus]MBC9875435.1 hypothetical protein [Macrococcus bohemicus]
MNFIKNIAINILSQSIFIIVQQLLLFPHFEQILGADAFGKLLLFNAMISVFSITLAASFTNMFEKHYHTNNNEDEKLINFYHLLRILILYHIIGLLPMVLVIYYIYHSFMLGSLLFILILITSLRFYLFVMYRVQRKFNKILKFNLIIGTFYSVLYFIEFKSVEYILLGFIAAELMVLIIIIKSMNIHIDKIIHLKGNIYTRSESLMFLISGLSGAMLNYADRFIIGIFLGQISITLFYVITLPTKLLLFPINMASNVIMSYLARYKRLTSNLRKLVLINLPVIFFGVSIVTYFVGQLIIGMLYPKYLNQITDIYPIVTVTFSIICLDVVLRGFLVKFYSTRLKTLIEFITLISFVICSSVLLYITNDLYYFALSQLIVFSLKVLVQIIIFTKLEYEEE